MTMVDVAEERGGMRRRQALLDFAVAHSRAIFYVAELEGDAPVRFVSRNLETITGHPVESFYRDRRYGRGLLHPDDAPAYAAQMARLEELGAVSHLYRFRTADGSWLWFRDDVRLLPHEEGRPREFVGCMIDVTAEMEAESALRATRAFTQAVVESSHDGIVATDEDGRVVSFSAAALEQFGYDEAEVIGRPVAELIVPPHLRRRHATGFARFKETGVGTFAGSRLKTEAMRCDGSIFPVEIAFAEVNVAGSRQFVADIRDITERVEAERRSRHLAQLLQDAVDSLPHGFSVENEDGTFEVCNKAFARFYGREPADLVGRHRSEILGLLLERIDTADAQRLESPAEVSELLDRSRGGSMELRLKSGQWLHVTRQVTSDGRVTSLRSDVTSLKAAQEAAQASNDFIMKLLDACPVPFGMSRLRDSFVLYESPASKALYQRDFSRGPVYAVNNFARPEDRDVYIEMLRREGYVDSFKVMLRRTDGTEFPGSLSGRLIEYDDEEVIVFASTDLTRQLEIEAEMARQSEVLYQSEKLSALGELLSGIAHELNNPLSVLVGQALLLRETVSDPAVRERAEKIGNAADRCARIVKTFLAMARQRPARSAEVDVNELVEATIDVTGYALRASGVTLALHLSDDVPPVSGDPDQLQQVLVNLVVNAQHALEEIRDRRELKITTSYRPRQREVLIKVKDNGPGIPEHIKRRIFEPLFTTKDVGMGTGIGLALCHRILASHGGRIKVDSVPGHGAAFVVRLPAVTEGTSGEGPVDRPVGAAGHGKVLVIDDEVDVGQLVAEILGRDGYEVAVATSGQEALSLLRRQRFDAIISDLRMPGLDGMELHARLHASDPGHCAVLGFMTGDTMSARIRAFLEATRAPYVEKPILPQDVRDMLATLLGDGPRVAV